MAERNSTGELAETVRRLEQEVKVLRIEVNRLREESDDREHYESTRLDEESEWE